MGTNREDLLQAWLSFAEGDQNQLWAMVEMLTLAENEPDLALDMILELLARARSDQALGQLTAGPLERLIWKNGRAVIDRVEAVATTTPRLAELLKGIYRIDVPQDVWERIVKISGRTRQMTPSG